MCVCVPRGGNFLPAGGGHAEVPTNSLEEASEFRIVFHCIKFFLYEYVFVPGFHSQ